MTKKNKDYITLANERADRQAKAQENKNKLDREKFHWNKKKDIKNGIVGILIGIPVAIIIITFTIIWVKLILK